MQPFLGMDFFAFPSILTLTECPGLAIFSGKPEKKPDSQKSESGFGGG